MSGLPTTVAGATAEAERVLAECLEAGAGSRLLSCVAVTATYDAAGGAVRTYGPLNAALAWAHGAGSSWCRSAEDWERDGRSVARKEMAVPVLVKSGDGMALLRRYPYEATEGGGAVTEPVNGRSCERRIVDDILSAGEVDLSGTLGMVEAYFGVGDVSAPADAGGWGQDDLKRAIACFKASASAAHRAYEGRGGAYRPRRIEPAKPLPVAAEVLAPAEVTDGAGVMEASWEGYAGTVKPLINLLASCYARGSYDAGYALECFRAAAAEVKRDASFEDACALMRRYLPELAEDCLLETEIARAMEGLR